MAGKDRQVCVVEVRSRVEKSLRKIPAKDRGRIDAVIGLLSYDPWPPKASKVRGRKDAWRVRVGDYRIIYNVHDDRLVVVVVTVGHRREVYR